MSKYVTIRDNRSKFLNEIIEEYLSISLDSMKEIVEKYQNNSNVMQQLLNDDDARPYFVLAYSSIVKSPLQLIITDPKFDTNVILTNSFGNYRDVLPEESRHLVSDFELRDVFNNVMDKYFPTTKFVGNIECNTITLDNIIRYIKGDNNNAVKYDIRDFIYNVYRNKPSEGISLLSYLSNTRMESSEVLYSIPIPFVDHKAKVNIFSIKDDKLVKNTVVITSEEHEYLDELMDYKYTHSANMYFRLCEKEIRYLVSKHVYDRPLEISKAKIYVDTIEDILKNESLTIDNYKQIVDSYF